MSQILVFGDSIAYGRWDTVRGGWVNQLIDLFMKKDLIDPNFYHEVYNLSIDGDDTQRLLNRFKLEVKQRLIEDKDAVIIFSIGSNDAEFDNQTKKLRILQQDFKNNLTKLADSAKEISSKLIFTGLLPVDELKVDPIPWLPEVSYKNEYIKQYNNIIKSICQENNIDFIEIFDKFEKLDYKKLLEDGVHPNSEGHKIIFETVKDFLINKKMI